MSDNLILDIQPDGVAVITFNRPQAHNALDLATMRRFAETVEVLETHPDVRVVLLTGAGEEAFCSGGDVVELSQHPSEEGARSMITLMGDALFRLEKLPIPVIAAINGYALGGGGEIAVACDMRIADENTRMSFVQIRLALTPGWGAGQRLLRLVGYSRAMEMLLRGAVMHAPELLVAGLVDRVVDAHRALPHALHFARQIASDPPDVVRGVKRLLRAGLTEHYENALLIERGIFPPLWAAEPHLTAVENFLKRKQVSK